MCSLVGSTARRGRFASASAGSMNPTPQKPGSVPINPRHLQTVELVERPPAERPSHDTIEAIAAWIVGPARRITSGPHAFDEFAWRLLAAGLPLLRVTIHTGMLHPQFVGLTIQWWRTTGQTTVTMVRHEIIETLRYEDNPVLRVRLGGETLRRRIDIANSELDFPILHDLKASGGTDYFALPVPAAHGGNYALTFVTDRPDGFTQAEISDLTHMAHLIAVVGDMHSQRALARNVLTAYLGAMTGPKVLDGQIRRGTGQTLDAVLWSSDLRGFTERSDRLPGDRMIAILNALFDAQANVIHAHGGEILKFIGDGVLAIFPIAASTAAEAARNALLAAFETKAAVENLTHDPHMVVNRRSRSWWPCTSVRRSMAISARSTASTSPSSARLSTW